MFRGANSGRMDGSPNIPIEANAKHVWRMSECVESSYLEKPPITESWVCNKKARSEFQFASDWAFKICNQ